MQTGMGAEKDALHFQLAKAQTAPPDMPSKLLCGDGRGTQRLPP